MNRQLSIMKIIGLILFFILFFLSTVLPVKARAALTLEGMNKEEAPYHTRITLDMSGIPQFKMNESGQRVDLLLSDTDASQSISGLPEDETVVRILLAKKHDDLMVSILLRRPPKQVVAESRSDPAQVILDLYWEESDTARPAIAFRIADMPPRKPGSGASRFQNASPWDGRWLEFYRDYRRDWDLELPLRYTLPPLPPLVTGEQGPLASLQQLLSNDMFLSLERQAAELKNLNAEQAIKRDLLVAEARLRNDRPASAVPLLDKLRNTGEEHQGRVEYLTAYAQAVNGQPVVAQLTLKALWAQLGPKDPLLPLSHLLSAEAALVANLDKPALQALEKEGLDWPEMLRGIVALRRADAHAGSGDMKTAVDAYRELFDIEGLTDYDLFSINRAAFSAFQTQSYTFASDLYRRLIEKTPGQPEHDMLLFAAGASAYEAGDTAWGLIGLERAALDEPGSEGADRARLRLLDHQVIEGGEIGLAEAAVGYGTLAESSQYRGVREESFFKEALAHYLLMEHRTSVDELMVFRRDYRSSHLRREADLLLARQLPKVVNQLLAERNDLEAVVLVEQNRKLLLSSRLDRAFLKDLATAFDRLGLYDRAARVLLYMFDRLDGQPEKQQIYLPLARSFFKRGEYSQASDFASRYLDRFPEGEDAGELFAILMESFKKQGREDEMLGWLERTGRPSSPEVEITAAWHFWDKGDMAAVLESLERARELGTELQVKEMALLAEASYRMNMNSRAEKNYRKLFEDPEFGSQARYRTAQLLLRQQKRGQAVALLEELVAQNSESSWSLLARDLLIQEKR